DTYLFNKLVNLCEEMNVMPLNSSISDRHLVTLCQKAIAESHQAVIDPTEVTINESFLNRKSLEFSYLFHDHETKQAEFEAKVEAVIRRIMEDAKSPYDYILACYEYLTQTVAYDEAKTPEGESAWGALMNEKASSNGIAFAYKVLLDMVGIRCGIALGEIRGENGWLPHTWNVVELDGQFYHVDVTWGLDALSLDGEGLYDYFMCADEEIRDNHLSEDQTLPPCLSYQHNYFIEEHAYALNKLNLKSIIKNQILENTGTIYCKIKKDVPLLEEEALAYFEQMIDRLNLDITSYRYSYNKALRVLHIEYKPY
ncbi:MAG: transglutaminase domain-containing protein, partial [bacterium]